jgi:hypothetical protein
MWKKKMANGIKRGKNTNILNLLINWNFFETCFCQFHKKISNYNIYAHLDYPLNPAFTVCTQAI